MQKTVLLFSFLCFLTAPLISQVEDDDEEDMYMERSKQKFVYIDANGKKGFMFGFNLGLYIPDNDNAGFYDGTPKGEGFLDLQDYINNPRVRQEIQNDLGNNVGEFQFAGYPEQMRYTKPILLGAHLRYHFNWRSAIVADFNFVRLKADGLWSISYPPTNGTSQQVFQNYAITGEEDRLMASLGYQVSLSPPGNGGVHFEFGPSLTSVKVRNNRFSVGSREYNILRAQSLGVGNQILNNNIPTQTNFGGYAQLGMNLEFDKFTVDFGWRSIYDNIALNPVVEQKSRFQHAPFIRFVYRLTVQGY